MTKLLVLPLGEEGEGVGGGKLWVLLLILISS